MVTGGWYTRGWLGTLTTVTKKHKNEEEVKFNRINFTTTFKIRRIVGMGFSTMEHNMTFV